MCGGKDAKIIVAHGTSQDMASSSEATVEVVKQANVEGREVVQVGGPGSSDRATRRPPSIDDGSSQGISLPTDYLYTLGAGVAYGGGMSDIVAELVECIGSTERGRAIHLIGFSRGAVASAMALEQWGKLVQRGDSIPPSIKFTCLDPVPGPIGIPKQITLPRQVKEFEGIFSQNEGRPGFQHLNMGFQEVLDFSADICIGVHGDIGGSTLTPLAALNRDRVLQSAGLGGSSRLTPDKKISLALDCLLNASDYTDKFKFLTRSFEGPDGTWTPSQRAVVQSPSSGIISWLRQTIVGKLLLGTGEPVLNERMLPLIRAELGEKRDNYDRARQIIEQRQGRSIQLIETPAPVNIKGQVKFPAPRIQQLPQMKPEVAGLAGQLLFKAAPMVLSRGRIKF